MPVDSKILALLVCPENHQPLQTAPQDLLDQTNAQIRNGQVRTRSGAAVSEPLTEGLVRQDGACLYRVDEGIPNLLVDDRIDLG